MRQKLPHYLLSELGQPNQCQTPRTWPMLLCLQNRPMFQERPEAYNSRSLFRLLSGLLLSPLDRSPKSIALFLGPGRLKLRDVEHRGSFCTLARLYYFLFFQVSHLPSSSSSSSPSSSSPLPPPPPPPPFYKLQELGWLTRLYHLKETFPGPEVGSGPFPKNPTTSCRCHMVFIIWP